MRLTSNSYYDTEIDTNIFDNELNWIHNGKMKRLPDKAEKQLSEYEYQCYLKKLRENDLKKKINNMSLSDREKLVPLLRKVMKISRMLSGIEIVKLNDKLPKTNGRPIIFVLTHVGKDDIMIFSDVIDKHYTILSGDYESLHNNVEGLISMLNGIVFFDMKSVKERKSVVNLVSSVLNSGDNILCSMEAAWNLSPNVIVQELFPGMIESAIKSNALIIPVGIERFNSKLYGINVASEAFDPNIYVEQYGNTKEMYDICRSDLRNIMSQLKFEIYFHENIYDRITVKREDIGNYNDYLQKYKDDILKGWSFTEAAINEKRYHNKCEPASVYHYVLKKYENLINIIYDAIYSQTGTDYVYFQNESNKLLIDLINDIKNEIYPNDIHEKLVNIYNKIVDIIDNNEIIKKEEKTYKK